ncbi:metal ABC transporter solute-binding protein, Zn/Mn family [Microbacterium sp. SA39]|uniref:metal ABC transporter solute-binding protein, Zn/Mn family n=1 Tax=Microbacterium sp. SA39 TaxID=1263625 RepID=UPI0005FA373B|nr:zinc ABC transporter substrate-binding protein [Microbacterium sp. SA39]KJQ52876.1 Metal ABC transporter substrate-binding lipoprotein precursor [Microbacterium sp. SA39]
MKKPVVALALVSVAALTLAGCSTPATGEGDDGTVQVVASTNVYGSIAAQIGGDRVEVTSIIESATQDPHSYEVTARDRLSVQEAGLVIENGGGYDPFVEELLDGSDAAVLTAAEISPDFPGSEGQEDAEQGAEFNEHVWFDPRTMIDVVGEIAAQLTELDPEGKADFTAAADEIIADLEGFETDLDAIKTDAGGASVFITEPLPGYLAAAAGLTDVTPEGFAESVEEGTDVAPAVLLDALNVIGSGEVTALLTNAQTGGAETDRVEAAAKDAGIPVVAFTELLEDGSSYSEWMSDAITSLAAAVQS